MLTRFIFSQMLCAKQHVARCRAERARWKVQATRPTGRKSGAIVGGLMNVGPTLPKCITRRRMPVSSKLRNVTTKWLTSSRQPRQTMLRPEHELSIPRRPSRIPKAGAPDHLPPRYPHPPTARHRTGARHMPGAGPMAGRGHGSGSRTRTWGETGGKVQAWVRETGKRAERGNGHSPRTYLMSA